LYEAQAQAIRIAAARAKPPMTPAEFQAATWVWDLTSTNGDYKAIGHPGTTPPDASRIPKEASLAASGATPVWDVLDDSTPIGYYDYMAEVLGFEPALTASGATYGGPRQARAPRGTPIGGRWIDVAGGLLDRVTNRVPSEEGMDEDWGDQGPTPGKPLWRADSGLTMDAQFGPPGEPRSLADMDPVALVATVNPGHATMTYEDNPYFEQSQYMVNCQRVVFAVEMQARGYHNVVANGAPEKAYPSTQSILDKMSRTRVSPISGNHIAMGVTLSGKERSHQDILRKMSRENPAGARFIVFGATPTTGHVWNAEILPNGDIVERDGQSLAKPSDGLYKTYQYVRVDDVEFDSALWDGDNVPGSLDKGTSWVQTPADFAAENEQSVYQEYALGTTEPLPRIVSLTDEGDRWLVEFDEPIWDDRVTYVIKATREIVRELPAPGALVAAGGNPTQARVGKGSEHGGEWIDTPGGLLQRVDAYDAKGNKRKHGINRQSVADTYAKSPFASAFAPLDESERGVLAETTRAALQEAVAEGVKVNVPMPALEGIVESGRFKTYAEIDFGNSKGTRYSVARSQYEATIMGVPKDRDYPERPVYGYGTAREYAASSYGDVTIHLKDSVKDRTTWTVDDSLDRQSRPLWTDEVDTADTDTLVASSNWSIEADTPLRVSDYYEDGPYEGGTSFYVEAQVHGGVSVGDIDSIEVEDITRVPASVADYARDNNIPLTEKGSGYTYDDYRGDESYRD
jgi:hypothetical protein